MVTPLHKLFRERAVDIRLWASFPLPRIGECIPFAIPRRGDNKLAVCSF